MYYADYLTTTYGCTSLTSSKKHTFVSHFPGSRTEQWKGASLLVQLTLFNKRSVSAAHYHIFQPMFSPLRSLFTSLGLNNLSPPRSRFHLALARSLAPSIKAVYRWFILSNRFVPIIIIIIITEPLNILSAMPSEDEENPALCRQYR
jgi:hypothetical protein